MSITQYSRSQILVVVFCLIQLLPTSASATDTTVKNAGELFLATIPASWSVEMGSWEYFNILDCFTQPGKSCSGSNPSSPYGFPVFSDQESGLPVNTLQLAQQEAVVIFLRTPPKSRYFAFSQYLVKSQQARIPEFGSLSDSLNNLLIRTSGSLTNSEPFDSYAVLVWTPDLGTYKAIYSLLIQQGIDPASINFIPLPVEIPGHQFTFKTENQDGDEFGMLSRVALPTSQEDLNAYMDEKPYFVLKVNPGLPEAFNPAPVIGYAEELTGQSEVAMFPYLESQLDQLLKDIRRNYRSEFRLSIVQPTYTEKTGWDCIRGDGTCAGDNHDAFYTQDTGVVIPKNLKDFVLVVGVNHQKTGKASYINHSVYDLKKMAGIVAISDPGLTEASAIYHAGLDPQSWRAKLYKNVYAYMISYDCSGRSFCLQIPAPTESDPIGLEPGSPFVVVGRSYLEPQSKVRPAASELVIHRTVIGSSRP